MCGLGLGVRVGVRVRLRVRLRVRFSFAFDLKDRGEDERVVGVKERGVEVEASRHAIQGLAF